MRPRPRIVLLAPAVSGGDGVSTVARDAWHALAGWAQGLVVLSLHDRPGGVSGPGRVLLAGGNRGRLVGWAAREALSCPRETIVLCMHLHLAPAVVPLWTRGARVFTFLHGVEAWSPLSHLRRAALGLPGVGLLANSLHTRRGFVRANPRFAEAAIPVCHLGVGDPTPSGPLPEGLEPGFALAIGRLHEGYKGHDELLEVWPDLMKSHPAARLVVAGDGPDRARLAAKARAQGLETAVRFLGRVSQEQREALYMNCAFLALPSRGEGFGLVYLEAMRAGRACLAGCGAPAEVVVHEETGLVVDTQDRQRLLAALARLFGDPALRARWGARGRARQQELFTLDAFGGRLRHLLGVEV